MRTATLAPSERLRPYIQRFLIVEYTSGWSNTLLPGPGMVAAFRFKGNCLVNDSKVPNALVTGLWDRTRTLTHAGSCANVLAMFTPTGAAALLREPLEHLFNLTMPLDSQARRSQLSLVEEQLYESSHHPQRVKVVEGFLLEQLRRRTPDLLVAAAVQSIRATRGSLRIDRLARHMGLSQSTLERRFCREVGTSPKKFAALVRLRHVVQLRRAGVSLTGIAHAAGYADQPHFIKDFKRFTGQAPESFFATATAFC
ncbi:MAG: helix-turn-helix transcriptional regulator [Terracidiphilus sp.]